MTNITKIEAFAAIIWRHLEIGALRNTLEAPTRPKINKFPNGSLEIQIV